MPPPKSSSLLSSHQRGSSFLSSLVVTVTHLQVDARSSIKTTVTSLGGAYDGNLTRQTTHLLALRDEGDKVKAARKWRADTAGGEQGAMPYVVYPSWLDECVKQGRRVDEAPYAVPTPNDEELMPPPPPKQIQGNSALDVLIPEVPKADDRRAGLSHPPFAGCTFRVVCQPSDEHAERTRRWLVALGGTVLRASAKVPLPPNETAQLALVTHAVIGDANAGEADAAALRAVVGAGAAVVNLHWVKRCAELWRLCEETDSRPREMATKAIQAARQSHQYINLNAPPPIVPAARTIITRQQPQPAQTQATLRTQPTQAAPQPAAALPPPPPQLIMPTLKSTALSASQRRRGGNTAGGIRASQRQPSQQQHAAGGTQATIATATTTTTTKATRSPTAIVATQRTMPPRLAFDDLSQSQQQHSGVLRGCAVVLRLLPQSSSTSQHATVDACAKMLEPSKCSNNDTADVRGACAMIARALGAACIDTLPHGQSAGLDVGVPHDASAVYAVLPMLETTNTSLPPGWQAVSPAWLRRCLLDWRRHDPTTSALFRPLVGTSAREKSRLHTQRICPSAYPDAERGAISDLCSLLGMKYTDRLTKNCTALVVPTLSDSEKCIKAAEWGIPCVTMSWLEECARTHTLVSAEGLWLSRRLEQQQIAEAKDDDGFEAAPMPAAAAPPAPAPVPTPKPAIAPPAPAAPPSPSALQLLDDARELQQAMERRTGGAVERRTSFPTSASSPPRFSAPAPRTRPTRRAPIAETQVQTSWGEGLELSQRVVYTRSHTPKAAQPVGGAGSQAKGRKKAKKATEASAKAAAAAAPAAAATAAGTKRSRASRGGSGSADPSPPVPVQSPPKRPKKAWLTGGDASGAATTTPCKDAANDDTLEQLGIWP